MGRSGPDRSARSARSANLETFFRGIHDGSDRRLKWYGHVMRREEHYVGRREMEMKVQGRRKRGRPKRRWLDKVKDDIKEKGLSADYVYDRTTWRRMLSYIDST